MNIQQLESYRSVRTELADIESELAQYGVRIAVQSASTVVNWVLPVEEDDQDEIH